MVIWLGWRGPAEASQKTQVPQTPAGPVVAAHPPDGDPVWKPNPGGESVFPSKTSAGIPVQLASKVDVIPQKAKPDLVPPTTTQAARPLLNPDDVLVVSNGNKASDKPPTAPSVESFVVEPPVLPPAMPSSGALGGVLTTPVTTTPELSPSSVSQGISGGRLIHRVSPVYPAQALLLRLEGRVILDATIFEDGTVHELAAVQGNAVLVRAAADAVQRWRYKPFELNGKPVKTKTSITVDFRFPSN